MDLIYIIDREPEESSPNFSIPGREDLTGSKKRSNYKEGIDDIRLSSAGLGGLTGTIALGALSALAPVSLLVGASVAIPTIYKLMTSDDKTELVPQESFDELKEYIGKLSLSKEQAVNRGFKFPPGHPRVGETYRLHPLAEHSYSSKQNLYIPEHIFDDVLFEERESELLTLLVHLGATQVEISKYVENFIEDEKSGSIEAGVEIAGSGSISGASNLSKGSNNKNIRTFSLNGKPWEFGNKLERDGYAWLNFEPSWNAIITAREIGGCTSATLEIKEASKYAANKEASLQLKAKIYSANGTLKFMEKDLRETSYIVKVSFSSDLTT